MSSYSSLGERLRWVWRKCWQAFCLFACLLGCLVAAGNTTSVHFDLSGVGVLQPSPTKHLQITAAVNAVKGLPALLSYYIAGTSGAVCLLALALACLLA